MARPLRKDYVGASHHVFVRGVARSAISTGAADYERALHLLEQVVAGFEIQCHAWCFLPNHSHFLVTSTLGNLSRAMHWFGTCTAQSFNQRHERSGHVYQGRFGSRLIEDDDYWLELARYVPLNPVKAELCAVPEDWPWSSYAATTGVRPSPWFLDDRPLVNKLGSPTAYADWVAEGVLSTWLDEHGAPLLPRRPPLSDLLAHATDAAIARAHFRHGYTKAAIATHLGVSRAQIRRRLTPST